MASTNDTPSPTTTASMPAASEVDDHTQALVRQLSEVRDVKQRQKLCEEIIVSTLPVADRLAARYRDRGIPIDDLRQVARAALVQAMRRFRGAGRESFLAYAIPCMRGELRRHFRDAGWVVRPPRRIQEARPVVALARAELQHDLGHDPTPAEIASETGLDVGTVREASGVGHCFQPESLDQPIGSAATDATVGDSMGVSDPGFDQAEARALIGPLLDGLGPRDRQLMVLRFFDGLTQRETGERIGVSQMQVSRVEARILRTFRKALAA